MKITIIKRKKVTKVMDNIIAQETVGIIIRKTMDKDTDISKFSLKLEEMDHSRRITLKTMDI